MKSHQKAPLTVHVKTSTDKKKVTMCKYHWHLMKEDVYMPLSFFVEGLQNANTMGRRSCEIAGAIEL